MSVKEDRYKEQTSRMYSEKDSRMSAFFVCLFVAVAVVVAAAEVNKPFSRNEVSNTGNTREKPFQHVLHCIDDNCGAEDRKCTNTADTFSCSRTSGYPEDDNNSKDDNCGAEDRTCTNTADTFLCPCNSGYPGDDSNSKDDSDWTDDCAVGGGTCANIPDSFSCTCNSGYPEGGINSRDGADNCAVEGGTCTNILDSFSCACYSGYQGDDANAKDDTECSEGSINCPGGSMCVNTLESFNCSSETGYHGYAVKGGDEKAFSMVALTVQPWVVHKELGPLEFEISKATLEIK